MKNYWVLQYHFIQNSRKVSNLLWNDRVDEESVVKSNFMGYPEAFFPKEINPTCCIVSVAYKFGKFHFSPAAGYKLTLQCYLLVNIRPLYNIFYWSTRLSLSFPLKKQSSIFTKHCLFFNKAEGDYFFFLYIQIRVKTSVFK